MTSFNKRVSDMLLRVLAFAAAKPQLFTAGSLVAALLAAIDQSMQRLSAHESSQTSAREDARISTIKRSAARDALREQIDAIGQTAKALKFQQFWQVRDRSDRALAQTAETFIQRAEPLRDAFIENHLPADFIERLKSSLDELNQTIRAQVNRESARIASTTGLEQTRNDALAALERLDPLMENLLRDDLPTLAAWRSARRVERYSGRKRPEPTPPAAVPTPAAS